MATFLLRVWMPDRPGALGAVTSRIGAVGGDVVGIEILETGGGRVIDELVIELPGAADGVDPSLDERCGLLLSEVAEVDGVDVERFELDRRTIREPRLDAFETAAELVAAHTVDEAVSALSVRARAMFRAGWSVVVHLEGEVVVAGDGPAPALPWLLAFVRGSQTSARVSNGDSGPADVLWAPLPTAGMALVVGRDGDGFRANERRCASALARIVDARFRELELLQARRDHPAATAWWCRPA
jgi:hypothetical protein